MENCPLTGEVVQINHSPNPVFVYYNTRSIGKVQFTDIAFGPAYELTSEEKDILAGICRNRDIRSEEPLMIQYNMLGQLKNQQIPYGFQEKCRHFLQYLYDHVGKEYQEEDLNSANDRFITYSSKNEFERIIKYLNKEGLIAYDHDVQTKSYISYQGLYLTKEGVNEIEKGLPKQPMFGLISQEISTGDPEIDKLIEFARKSFFDTDSTFESKRSSCETLSYVLEPLRNELKSILNNDAETFFNLVNSFDIRHNKPHTKNIQHEEQLEWVFYSLLNTVNVYFKLKKKLN